MELITNVMRQVLIYQKTVYYLLCLKIMDITVLRLIYTLLNVYSLVSIALQNYLYLVFEHSSISE